MATSGVLVSKKTNEFKEYVREYTAAARTNQALSIAVIVLAAGLVGVCAWAIHFAKNIVHEKPIVVRVEKIGRAEAVNTPWDEYQPQDNDMKYFLIQFVTGFYARNHHTIQDVYPAVLHYLRSDVFDQTNAQDRRTKWMAKFINSADPDVYINVSNVALDRGMAPAYKAQVDGVEIYTGGNGQQERTVPFVVTIWFHSRPELLNDPKYRDEYAELVKYNPLVFLIDSFRDDNAFADTTERTN